MEIKLDLKIILFAIIFYFTNQLQIYVLCILFALIHELGHILVARILGYKLKTLRMMPIGFSIYLKTNVNDFNKKILKGNKYCLNNLFISIAGPLTNIIIFVITLFLNINIELKTQILYINILISIFNLLPIYPLDGIRIINFLLRFFFNNKKCYYYTNKIANAFLVGITIISIFYILYVKNMAILLILIYLWSIAYKENKIQKTRKAIYEKI